MFGKTVTVLSLIASALAQSTLMINTPAALVECQPIRLSWSGGTAPYFLSILPGGQVSATPLEQFDQTSDTSYTWTVNIAAGTSITLQIRDSQGNTNYGSQVTIQSGTSTSCLSGGSSPGTSATTQGTTGAVPTVAAALPSGLYGVSQPGFSAFPSASYSLLGSASGVASYAVVETLSAAAGEPSAVTGILVNGPSAYELSLDGSGAASTRDVYASCSVSGSSAVCVEQANGATSTFTAPFAELTATAAPAIKRALKFAREY